MDDPVLETRKTTTVAYSLRTTVDNAIKNWTIMSQTHNIPKNAKIAVCIPGGGDWSNEDIDAPEINCRVTWTSTRFTDE